MIATTSVDPGPGQASGVPGVIALATDLTGVSEPATDQAIELAARLGSRLVVVNVLERRRLAEFGAHDRDDQARAEREQALRAVVRRARNRGIPTEFLVWSGEAGPGILAAAEAEGADLIVVGTRGRDRAGRLLLGSVSDHLVRNASMSVMVVRRSDVPPEPAGVP